MKSDIETIGMLVLAIVAGIGIGIIITLIYLKP